MSVLIIGANGNMGRRYATILKYLGHDSVGVDVGHNKYFVRDLASKSEGIIIATPTETHAGLIHLCADLGKPILCEKPITKDMDEMTRLVADLRLKKTNLTMVHQYKELVTMPSIGWTYYNYWNHGKDGLIWDCIQIIALGRSEVSLQNDSPLWHCRINGKSLKLSDMDRAYVKFVARWMRTPGQDISEIQAIHEKVDAFDRSQRRVIDK